MPRYLYYFLASFLLLMPGAGYGSHPSEGGTEDLGFLGSRPSSPLPSSPAEEEIGCTAKVKSISDNIVQSLINRLLTAREEQNASASTRDLSPALPYREPLGHNETSSGPSSSSSRHESARHARLLSNPTRSLEFSQ